MSAERDGRYQDWGRIVSGKCSGYQRVPRQVPRQHIAFQTRRGCGRSDTQVEPSGTTSVFEFPGTALGRSPVSEKAALLKLEPIESRKAASVIM